MLPAFPLSHPGPMRPLRLIWLPQGFQKEKKQSDFTGSEWAQGHALVPVPMPPINHSISLFLQQFKSEYVSLKIHLSPIASLRLGIRVVRVLCGNKEHINITQVSQKTFFFFKFRKGSYLNRVVWRVNH